MTTNMNAASTSRRISSGVSLEWRTRCDRQPQHRTHCVCLTTRYHSNNNNMSQHNNLCCYQTHKLPSSTTSDANRRRSANNVTKIKCHYSMTTTMNCKRLLPLLLCLLAATLIGAEEDPMLRLAAFASTRISAANAAPQATSRASSDAREPVFGGANDARFARINELDAFLDDMNHNELREVASGKPIGDLFQPKPAPSAAHANHHNSDETAAAAAAEEANMDDRPRGHGHSHKPQESAAAAAGKLDTSTSEHQVYSECALILQRTYVRNVDGPK